MSAFLSDNAGRWNLTVQLFGGAFTGKSGTLSTRTTWGTALNDQHLNAIGAYASPSPDWHWGVDFCAVTSVSIRNDPSIPVGGLTQGAQLNVVAPPQQCQDSYANRQAMLFDGLSTYKAQGWTVYVDRAITTFQRLGSNPDNAYLSGNTPYQLMAYIRALNTMLGTTFNQYKLVPDGSRIPPGSQMTTSQLILASVIAQYRAIAAYGIPGCPVGLVTNPTFFVANATAENAGGGVVKMLLPAQLGGQLIAIASSIQFRLT
jgi:phage tail sheath gpL-like